MNDSREPIPVELKDPLNVSLTEVQKVNIPQFKMLRQAVFLAVILLFMSATLASAWIISNRSVSEFADGCRRDAERVRTFNDTYARTTRTVVLTIAQSRLELGKEITAPIKVRRINTRTGMALLKEADKLKPLPIKPC